MVLIGSNKFTQTFILLYNNMFSFQNINFVVAYFLFQYVCVQYSIIDKLCFFDRSLFLSVYLFSLLSVSFSSVFLFHYFGHYEEWFYCQWTSVDFLFLWLDYKSMWEIGKKYTVVYLDQRLGDAHSKHCTIYAEMRWLRWQSGVDQRFGVSLKKTFFC